MRIKPGRSAVDWRRSIYTIETLPWPWTWRTTIRWRESCCASGASCWMGEVGAGPSCDDVESHASASFCQPVPEPILSLTAVGVTA
jgi:hypothetical protein